MLDGNSEHMGRCELRRVGGETVALLDQLCPVLVMIRGNDGRLVPAMRRPSIMAMRR
jgi:hypothetical protein